MSTRAVEAIADALLYEGYMLYPYRPSAVKNRQRFNFGVIYPQSSNVSDSEGPDSHLMQTEILVKGDPSTALDVKVRFLQLVDRTIGSAKTAAGSTNLDDYTIVDALDVDGRILKPWQEAVERSVIVEGIRPSDLVQNRKVVAFTFSEDEKLEPANDAAGVYVGVIIRRQRTIDGEVELSATEPLPGTFKIRARITNVSSIGSERARGRDELLLHSLVSAHSIFTLTAGTFISLLDPQEPYQSLAAECNGIRSWPVLVGEQGQTDTMLASPIIIYDYPLIAPESAGDLFDGTEIDEILSLRILTMTDSEKREMRDSDHRARALLDRTEALGAEDFMKMHGIMREMPPTHGAYP